MFNELVWGASQQGEAFEKLGEHLASRHSSTLGLRAGATLRWLLLASCLVLAVSLYGQSSSKDYIRLGGRVIAIENQGVSITTASSLPPATLNAAYTTTISVNGGTAPYSWSWAAATGSSLPTGLSLGSSCTSTTCTISGTPTSAGTYSVVVSVMDANKLNTSSTFQITVASGPTITSTSPLPTAPMNIAYTTTIFVTGGTAPYSWSWAAATGSSLPTGLSLGSSCTSTTCAISGTPTSAGTYSAVVSVMDANKLKTSSTFQITVASGPAITTTSPLPPASISTAYTTTISVTGGTAPYSWSWAAATGSSLPTGLLLGSSCSSTTCTVSGTPASAGTYSVVVTVTDANQLKTNSTFQITVSLALNITTTSLPGGTVNSSYSATVAASGGTTPYSWSAATGSLAPGLSLASSTGAISGITITGGTFSPTITVTDAKGATAVKTFQITVATSPLTILTSTTATTSAGGLFVIGLNASGGTTPYTWSVSAVQGVAPLPAVSIGGNASQGWTLNFQSANSDSGNYTFVVTVMDSSQPALTTGSTFMFTVSPSGVSVSDNSPVAYAGGTDIVSARNPSTGGLENANWALTGVGSISPTSNVSQTTYAAPVPVTPDQVVSVTATAGGASASVTVTLELPATTVTPSTGTLYTGQPITFTVSGMGDSWSTTNNYMFLNVTPVASGFYFDFAHSCMVEYQPSTQTVYLPDDADDGSFFSGIFGTATILQNSQCSVNLQGTSSITNYVLTMSLPITFKSGFTGAMYLNVQPYDSALNESQTFYDSQITIAAGALAAPTGLTATAGNASVALVWSASTGATSYSVYRGTTSGGESATAIASGITTTSYSDTAVTNGTKYYYEVAAVNARGTSAMSSEASATPEPPAPAAPTGLTATAGSASVALAWTASTGATSYNVYRGTTSGGESATAIATGITATSYSDTTVTSGTTYYYKVAAVNGGGTSAMSTEASATPSGTIPSTLTISSGMTASAPCTALNTITIGGNVTVSGNVTCTAGSQIILLPGFTAVGSSGTTFTAVINPNIH